MPFHPGKLEDIKEAVKREVGVGRPSLIDFSPEILNVAKKAVPKVRDVATDILGTNRFNITSGGSVTQTKLPGRRDETKELPQPESQPLRTKGEAVPKKEVEPTVKASEVFKTGEPTPNREVGAKAFIPLAFQEEERRAAEEGKEPVPGLAQKLIAIFDQESDFGSNPNAFAGENDTGDLGHFQINDVYTKPGQGAHGLFIEDKDRLDFEKSFNFASDFLTTFYRVNKRQGMSDEQAWARTIEAWNANPDFPGFLEGEIDQLRREGLLE